jgi:hypothetical protein
MVDFTRPALSDDRCGLLALVPDLPPAERRAGPIRDAVLAAARATKPAAGSPAAELVRHLEAGKTKPIDHIDTLSRYQQACQARPGADVTRDGLKLRSLQRQLVFGEDGKLDDAGGAGLHPYLVFEFAQTMPVDRVKVGPSAPPGAVDAVALGARFSPIDCSLVSSFVAAAPAK